MQKPRSGYTIFPINAVISTVNRISLHGKAIIFTVALGTLPVLGIKTFAYYVVNQSQTKQIIYAKEDKANLLIDNVNSFMQRRYGDIQIFSKMQLLQNRKLRETVTCEQIQARLNNYLSIENSYESIAVLDINGNVIVESKGQLIPNQKNEDYFQTVLKTNTPYISQPLTRKNGDKPQIYMAAPVKDSETSQTIYIIRTVIPVKSLEKALNIPLISQDDYDLIDASGKIFLCKANIDVGKNVKEVIPEWKQMQAENQANARILFNKNEKIEELVTYVPWETIEGLPPLKWNLALSTDTAIAFEPSRILLHILGIGTVVVTLLSGAIATIIAHRLTLPIRIASMAVKKLGQGNLDTRIFIKGEDELATLVSNINQMAQQLQDLLYQQTAEAEQLKLFTNTLISIRQSLYSEDLFNITVTQARQALKADRVVIYHFSDKGSGQVIAESVAPDLPEALGETIEDACISPELIEAYRNGRVLAVNNVFQANFAPAHLALMERLQIKAHLITPIIQNNKLFGFLIAHHCQKPQVWQTYEINFLSQLAAQVGLTLERVSLLETTRAQKDLAIHLSETFNLENIYNLAVQDIQKALKADRAVIYKFDDNLHGKIIAESVAAGFPKALGADIHDPCLPNYIEKYRQDRVVAINNIYQADLTQCHIQQLQPFAVKANLVAPIIMGDKVLGLLIAHQCSQPRVWQQSEIDLFEQFARIVGLSLERANLLEQTVKRRDVAEKFSEQEHQQKEKLQLQLQELLVQIEGASRGDLTVRAEVTSGEIGTVADFFNSIVESLREIVTQVKLTATQVNQAIAGNSGAIDQLATQALKQSEEISHTLDSVEQMRLSIKEVAKSANIAAEVARNASHTAKTGGTTMDFTVENILSLRQTLGETAKKVKRLGESSQQISRVVSLINQIAQQTNLLAINTGIEAVRAGQAGQSFSVIAEEVASLAGKCTTATNEIEGIVANIQFETTEVVKAIELGTAQVVQGTHLVGHSKQSLSKIFNVCHQIDDLVQSISAATISQVQTSTEVTNLMKEMVKVSQMTSKSSHQVSLSLQTTLDISHKLQASVGTFKVD
ncbi:methyl accepting chemotaxis protein [Tolypothrix sp. NIES-4075]|uniref:GAF domain-containing protein n=1 Tax=Tolypothrix sp. NIES-4075 TaxID=2005459 RepID=UPI000B710148|nr:GAF domain-containing protein [Tolypothrix sp. NIES-4075]GAX39807.1 methyl accepting chemotaxis protein [Tolypothrix sp. NIES-4075]